MSEYSQATLKLAGFFDRVGDHACGGRDVGITFMGDLLQLPTHHLFRYEVGVYNGNGINKTDNNNSKDVIGTFSVLPIKHLQIGGGFWVGKFGPAGECVDRKRWTTGFKYDDKRYVLVGEYISSRGKTYGDETSGNKAYGWYLTAGAPFAK